MEKCFRTGEDPAIFLQNRKETGAKITNRAFMLLFLAAFSFYKIILLSFQNFVDIFMSCGDQGSFSEIFLSAFVSSFLSSCQFVLSSPPLHSPSGCTFDLHSFFTSACPNFAEKSSSFCKRIQKLLHSFQQGRPRCNYAFAENV